jgi:probable rRNA maturation factor
VKQQVKVELQRGCDVGSLPEEAEIRRWIEAAVRASECHATRGLEVVVRVVDEQESRDLNNRYRQKDRATNVLAFAADPGSFQGRPPTRRIPLGDLAICGPLVEHEAREQGKNPVGHWGHLLVHGTLHLLGYDHRTEAEAREMEQLETRILAERGFEDPYTVR